MAVSTLRTNPRPSNADIVDAISELHDCLHNVGQDVSAVKRDVGDVKERVARIEGYQEGVASKFNIPPAGEPKPHFVKRHKTPIVSVVAALSAVGAFITAYPFLRHVFLAIDAYLTTTKAAG